MDKPNDGGPAFPSTVQEDMDGYPRYAAGYGGMSLRDYFAGQAMGGQLADPDGEIDPKLIARWSYAYADAMLAEREKGRA